MGYKSPNEKLNIAAIGSGGKGATNLARPPPPRISLLFATWTTGAPPTPSSVSPNAPKYRDFRKMLDKEATTSTP